MDCIYHAWFEHARWLGITPRKWSYPLFRSLCALGGNDGGMYGGCVPLTVRLLNLTSGLRIACIQHHPFFDKATFIAGSETLGQRVMSHLSDFGEEGIDIQPAIYLWLKGQHAIFAEQKPTDKLTILAIQLERRECYVRANDTSSSVSLQRGSLRSTAG